MSTPYWIKNYQEEGFVKNYLNSYPDKTGIQSTSTEVDFIQKYIDLNKDSKIVDVCCANGRHVLEFARRGFTNVVGVDLSPLMLSLAKADAEREGLSANTDWQELDMRNLGNFEADLILNLFSSCGFFDTDEDNFAFFQSVNRALKMGGTFMLDLVPRESYIRNLNPQEWHEDENSIILREQEFNLDISRYVRKTIQIFKNDLKERTERYSSARAFSIYEVNEWLKKAGFNIVYRFSSMGDSVTEFDPNTAEHLCVIAVKEKQV